jgi:hypothetical protein
MCLVVLFKINIKYKIMKEIEQLFGGTNAEEQNILLHVIKERGYEFFEKTPKTTMTIRLLEDLHKLGYKIVKQG